MRKVVLYHGGGCADGFTAAWIFSKAFPSAEFIACNYGDPVPDVYGADVYILDFSWKRPEMIGLLEKAHHVTVLDHRPTARDELAGLDTLQKWDSRHGKPIILFDANHSGARMALDYARGDLLVRGAVLNNADWLVNFVEDRDLWHWKLPHSKEISAALRSYPMEFVRWDQLAERMSTPEGQVGLIAEGLAIIRDQAQTIAAHVKNAVEILIDGHRVLATNATTLISEIAGELATGRPFGCCYFDKGVGTDNPVRVWSARVRDGDFDVSELAKKFGGGGHVRAAGWQVKL